MALREAFKRKIVTFVNVPSENKLCAREAGLDNLTKLDLAFNNVKPKDWYFVLDLGSSYDRTGMCKTNKSKFLDGWIILGTWLLYF